MNITLGDICEYIGCNYYAENNVTCYNQDVIFFGGDITVLCQRFELSRFRDPTYEGFVRGVEIEEADLTKEKIQYLDSIVDKKKAIKFMIDLVKNNSEPSLLIVDEYNIDDEESGYSAISKLRKAYFNRITPISFIKTKDLLFHRTIYGYKLFGLGIKVYGDMRELFESADLSTKEGQLNFYDSLCSNRSKSARK